MAQRRLDRRIARRQRWLATALPASVRPAWPWRARARHESRHHETLPNVRRFWHRAPVAKAPAPLARRPCLRCTSDGSEDVVRSSRRAQRRQACREPRQGASAQPTWSRSRVRDVSLRDETVSIERRPVDRAGRRRLGSTPLRSAPSRWTRSTRRPSSPSRRASSRRSASART